MSLKQQQQSADDDSEREEWWEGRDDLSINETSRVAAMEFPDSDLWDPDVEADHAHLRRWREERKQDRRDFQKGVLGYHGLYHVAGANREDADWFVQLPHYDHVGNSDLAYYEKWGFTIVDTKVLNETELVYVRADGELSYDGGQQ